MDPMSLSGQVPRLHSGERRCLLKGCEQWFQPTHPQCRYCSAACREAARRWRRWHAQQKYRASDNGRTHRQQQARRYRQRCRDRPAPVAKEPQSAAALADHNVTSCEGKRPAVKTREVPQCPCDRPGCYVLFPAGGTYHARRFCCVLCRKALRCVLEREDALATTAASGFAARRPAATAACPQPVMLSFTLVNAAARAYLPSVCFGGEEGTGWRPA